MKAYTDYPFLAEDPDLAPIREIEVLGWDGNKYVTFLYEGKEYEIKQGYVYTKPARYTSDYKPPCIEKSKMRII